MAALTLDELRNCLAVEIETYREMAQEYALACQAFARADHEYRQAQARAYLSIAAEDEAGKDKKRTEPHRGAMVDKLVEMQQLAQRLAGASREGLRARLDASASAITAYQSLLKLETEETKLASFTQGKR